MFLKWYPFGPDQEGLWLGVPYFFQVFSLDFIWFYNEVKILSALVFKLVASICLPSFSNQYYLFFGHTIWQKLGNNIVLVE